MSARPRSVCCATCRQRRGPGAAPRAASRSVCARSRGSSPATCGITEHPGGALRSLGRAHGGAQRDSVEGREVPDEHQLAAVGRDGGEVFHPFAVLTPPASGAGSVQPAPSRRLNQTSDGSGARRSGLRRDTSSSSAAPSGVGAPPHTCRSFRHPRQRSTGS